MDINVLIKPIHEYLLWNNCSNHCDFCIQATQNRLKKEEQLQSVELVKKEIKSLKDSHILIMGGEVFDVVDSDIQQAINELFQQIHTKMTNDEIELLYINTNLLYDISWLCDVLKPFMDVEPRIRFTTSDDHYGRFKGRSKEKFYKNLFELRSMFPSMRIVSNTILTKPMCEAVLDGRYSLSRYIKETKCLVNTIPYFKVVNDELAPTKELVLRALKCLDEDVSGYGKEYCQNFLLPQKKILLQYQHGQLVNVSADNSQCGHCVNFKKCFSDTDDCFVCMLQDMIDSDFFG